MNNPLDLDRDALANANLTIEERTIWDSARAEIAALRQQLQSLEHQIRNLEQQVQEGSGHTVLTRPEFNREVARMLAFDERYGGISSVVYFDFENLDEITRLFGHNVANDAVRTVCDVLAKSIRSSDILGRLATEEFGVLLVRCDNTQAWKKGEQLAAVLRTALDEVSGLTIETIVSYGAYTFREDEDVATGLKQAAKSFTRNPNQD